MLSSKQNAARVFEPFPIMFIKSRLDFFSYAVQCIVGESYRVKFIGYDFCIGKKIFNEPTKERR